ncbi:head completion protein [Tenacibaculum phage PTm1]|uniref:Head completion nuclease n=2 Tax=Shirahamavirus PTm1 TaxID=2846435 RepID=A0A5S9EQJ1_9CAUD|nr:head completion protein [Tenacibaculum phage PTm1]BBI90393.1 head completion protein [Tenacibaculum phage PTm1]BBI90701.1 head completion protein [Tenacibaculum phage PTm5]
MSIKKLKPRMGKKSHYKQGYYDVRKSKKYYGDTPVIYRSGLEFKFMTWCERSPRVLKWSSEPNKSIKYTCPRTGKERNYYIDFIIELASGDKFLVEVKPFSQMKDAEAFSKHAKMLGRLPNINESNKVASMNDAKWRYAKKYAEKHNMKFIIITERFKFI